MPLLRELWQSIRRHRFLIGGAGLAALIAALIITLLTPPTYRANVRIQVNPEATQIIALGSVDPAQKQDITFIETNIGLLQARSLAERVARSLKLGSNPAYANQSLSQGQRLQSATSTLASNLQIVPRKQSRIIDLFFNSRDKTQAATIANSFADNFVQSNLDRKFDQSAFARDFLKQRLEAIRLRLEDSERGLVVYAREAGLVTIQANEGKEGATSQTINSVILSSLTKSVADSEARRIETGQKYVQAQRNTGGRDTIQSVAMQPIQSELAQLRAQYAEQSRIFKPDYPDMQKLADRIRALEQQMRSFDTQTARSQSTVNLGNLAADYRAAQGQERELKARLDDLKGGVLTDREKNVRYGILQREVDTNRALYDALLQRYKEVGVAGGVGENLISIVDRAIVPSRPVSPVLPLNLLIGLALGLSLGAAGAFAYDIVNETISSPADIEESLNVKALGAIPLVEDEVSISELLEDPKSPVTEAYFNVSNLLRFATTDGIPKVLAITSSLPGEGKSSTAYGLARSLARIGKNVLLVDADLRRPTFRVSGDRRMGHGLTNLLTGDKKLSEIVAHIAPSLSLVPAGDIPPNPSELFSGARVETAIKEMSDEFDVVILDCPPLLGFVDAPILAAISDGVLVVFEAGRVRVPMAKNSISRLNDVGAYVVGALVTKFSDKHDDYGADYGYTYSYNYEGKGARSQKTDDRRIETVEFSAK